MPETNENPKTEGQSTCSRCGETFPADQVNLYRPNAGKHPTKTVLLCLGCAGKDPNAIPMKGPQVAPATQEAPAGPGTPTNEPQPQDTEPKITEFKPVPAAPLQTSQAPQPAETDKKIHVANNKAANVETKPISRVDIENRIAGFSADIEKLATQGNKLSGQLTQIKSIIEAKRGAIAGLESVLG